MRVALWVWLWAALCGAAAGRRYDLALKHERRHSFVVSSFGLLQGGHISLQVSGVEAHGAVEYIGFSVRQTTEEAAQHIFDYSEECIFELAALDPAIARVRLNLATGRFSRTDIEAEELRFLKMAIEPSSNSTEVVLTIDSQRGESIYTIAFHICSATGSGFVSGRFQVVEVNPGPDYLGAGKAELPAVYAMMAGAFLIASGCWVYVLANNRASSRLFSVHFLMLAVVCTKTMSLGFRAVDYHFIKREGSPEEGWAITYYIIFMTKGFLLFLAVLLIGAGFGFIKHALSQQEKQVFLLVIPLQVFSNIMSIMLEESSEGTARRNTFRSLSLLVDLFCCGAVLLVMNWSRRHLQQAALRDDKALASLQKQRLFQRFYIMVVAYIYTTRIIVFLIESTIAFPYEWLGAFVNEGVTLAFFTVTGYMFSPLETNPYLKVPEYPTEDVEMEAVVTAPVSTTATAAGLRHKKARPEAEDTNPLLPGP